MAAIPHCLLIERISLSNQLTAPTRRGRVTIDSRQDTTLHAIQRVPASIPSGDGEPPSDTQGTPLEWLPGDLLAWWLVFCRERLQMRNGIKQNRGRQRRSFRVRYRNRRAACCQTSLPDIRWLHNTCSCFPGQRCARRERVRSKTTYYFDAHIAQTVEPNAKRLVSKARLLDQRGDFLNPAVHLRHDIHNVLDNLARIGHTDIGYLLAFYSLDTNHHKLFQLCHCLRDFIESKRFTSLFWNASKSLVEKIPRFSSALSLRMCCSWLIYKSAQR